jgi:N-acetylneuraminate synthase/N,N'-diacetyllegionaminate synthase
MSNVFIIAEAGVNHNGDLAKAYELIDVAAESGADCVKFQTFKADKLVSKDAKKAMYQQSNLPSKDDSQFEMLKKLELSEEWHHLLKNYAISKGILFASTGFDEESVAFLDQLGQPFFKIPSGEITNKPLIEFIAKRGKEVILSTGMATMLEIEQTIAVLEKNGLSKSEISVLHCNTEYPTPMKDVNLLAMVKMHQSLGVNIGYSDHTLGIEVPIAAVALGAKIIEKHFTLDRTLPGPDHAASLEPAELKAMVEAIRNIELAIAGSGVKEPSPSELKNMIVARKSIHYAHKLSVKHVITLEDLIMKRPGDGVSPMFIDDIIGKVIRHKVKEGDKFSWEDVQ